MIPLTSDQIYQIAYAAGFRPPVVTTMVAIALRESAGVPTVHNGNAATGDDSYGLWQINLRDQGIRSVLAGHGIAAANLLDPSQNARAAFILFNGQVPNLDTLWYLSRTTPKYDYKGEYEKHLPVAQAAALRFKPPG